MRINRHNYESFFLDYSEGNLSPEEVAELLLFLELHADLKPELESFELIPLTASEGLVYKEKNSLKRFSNQHLDPINAANCDDHFIAFLEGDLNDDQHLELKEFLIRNPKQKLNFDQYQRLQLQANPSETYAGKHRLKKGGKPIVRLYQVAAIAASVLLLFSLPVFNTSDNSGSRDSEAEIAVLNSNSMNGIFIGRKNAHYPRSGNAFIRNAVNLPDIPAPEEKNGIEKTEVVAFEHEVVQADPKNDQEPVVFSEAVVDEIDELTSDDVPMLSNTITPERIDSVPSVEREEIAFSPTPSSSSFSSVNQFLKNRLVTIISSDKDRVSDENVSIGQTVSSGLAKAAGGELNFEKNEEGEVLAFALKLGKFELARSKRRNRKN